MPVNSPQEAEARLRDPAKLAPQQVRDLIPYMNQISEAGMRRLNAELALQNLEAVQQFENSSSKLTRWVVWLTVVLLILTGVIVWYSRVLARAEKKAAVPSQSNAAPQAAAKHILGPWQAKLTVPGTASLPADNPVIKCSLLKTADFSAGYLHLTFANLSDQSYVVKYVVLGYNKKGERISQGNDDFVIGKRESVARKDFLNSQDAPLSNPGSLFVIQLQLEEAQSER
jgi:hypothetical protein